jgi:ATP-dependent protease ClpP protease subunit
MDRFCDIYTRETSITEQKIKKILRRDVCMDSKKCLQYEVIDSAW